MNDLLLRNARIWTGTPQSPWAEAALVRDGRFAFVGRERDVEAPAGVQTLEAGGRLVVPGLVDGHAHVLQTGLAMRAVNLKDVPSVEEAVRRVAERVAATPAGGWVRGAGWDQNLWPGGRFPDRRELDAVAPDHPVVLVHTSGHCIWVNSAALRAAGVTRDTEAPFGGAIDLDGEGEPAGILRDAASRLVYDAVPRETHDDRVAAIQEAIDHAHSLGLTGVHAMSVSRGELRALQSMRDGGELRLRVRAFLNADRLDDWLGNVRTGDGDDMLRTGGVKVLADGALGSLTAWMLEPYEGTQESGLVLLPAEEIERQVRVSLEGGLAPAVHAIGDRANQEVLSILERTRELSQELPRRIEHAQLLTPDDIARFAPLGVTASTQPIHATQDMMKVDRWWGERGRTAYPFASLLESGVTLAFGSDAPVETMSPLAGIHAAVTRRNDQGAPPDGWYPEERISLEEAITANTLGCTKAVREDKTAGRIAPGYLADFAVLSQDLFKLPDPMGIIDTRVDGTVVGGDVVYRGQDW
jgi:predicted amidohydrolase YtcJ